MSKQLEQLGAVLDNKLKKASDTVFAGIVEEVYEDDLECDVRVEKDGLYRKVLLHGYSSADNQKGIYLLPAVGSQVYISKIGNTKRVYVDLFSEIDKIVVRIGDQNSVKFDIDGMRLQTGDTTVVNIDNDGLTLEVGDSATMKVDKNGFTLEADNSHFIVDNGGIGISKSGNGLKKTLEELCDAISSAAFDPTKGTLIESTKLLITKIKSELNYLN